MTQLLSLIKEDLLWPVFLQLQISFASSQILLVNPCFLKPPGFTVRQSQTTDSQRHKHKMIKLSDQAITFRALRAPHALSFLGGNVAIHWLSTRIKQMWSLLFQNKTYKGVEGLPQGTDLRFPCKPQKAINTCSHKYLNEVFLVTGFLNRKLHSP